MSLANPLQPREELERRERMYVARMGLDDDEVAVLRQAVAEFSNRLRSHMVQVESVLARKSPGLARKSPGASLSDTDRRFLESQADNLEARIGQLGQTLLVRLKPATAERIRSVVRREPYLRKGK